MYQNISKKSVLKQFNRRTNNIKNNFLYKEISKRMIEKLRYIKILPKNILDAGCGNGNNYFLIKKNYPNSFYIGLDIGDYKINITRKNFFYSILHSIINFKNKKISKKRKFIKRDLSFTKINSNTQDLIWSNLAIQWHPHPLIVFKEWYRILKKNGLLMFSWIGSNSMLEIKKALYISKLKTSIPNFISMENCGNLLFEQKFLNIVVNRDYIDIAYKSSEKLLNDIRLLGGNPIKYRKQGLTSRDWCNRLISCIESKKDTNGIIWLNLEINYGHAWKF